MHGDKQGTGVISPSGVEVEEEKECEDGGKSLQKSEKNTQWRGLAGFANW